MRKTALAVLVMASLGACTTAQVDQAREYQERIAHVCALAMTFAPMAGPIAPYIVGACSTEAAIAKLALDPSSLEWLHNLIYMVRGR